MEHHEIPAVFQDDLQELQKRRAVLQTEIAVCKARLYDFEKELENVEGRIVASASQVLRFMELDKTKPYALSKDSTAFVLSESR